MYKLSAILTGKGTRLKGIVFARALHPCEFLNINQTLDNSVCRRRDIHVKQLVSLLLEVLDPTGVESKAGKITRKSTRRNRTFISDFMHTYTYNNTI